MLLQSTLYQTPQYPQTKHLFIPIKPSLKRLQFNNPLTIKNYSLSSSSSFVSNVYSYGTVDYEKKPRTVTWKAIYKRISMMGNREKGSSSVLNQWENEGKSVTKWELCRLVKELRKYGRYNLALEVYDWMSKRPERFSMSPSDAAIQLDLVSKTDGISGAEDYFKILPDDLIDKRVYGSLLNAYVHAKKKDKAESLLLKVKEKDYGNHTLPYNVMMTLYMNLKDHNKVETWVKEMMKNNIDLDLYSYSIWITSRGSQGSFEKMEEVSEKMKGDVSVKPNWTTYSTLATVYINLGEFEKSDECLEKIESQITGCYRIPYHYLLSHYGSIGKKMKFKGFESKITGCYRIPYHYLLSHYGSIGKKDEVQRIWELIKLFSHIYPIWAIMLLYRLLSEWMKLKRRNCFMMNGFQSRQLTMQESGIAYWVGMFEMDIQKKQSLLLGNDGNRKSRFEFMGNSW